MERLILSALLLGVLVAASSAEDLNQISQKEFRQVKSIDELWRFQTGKSDNALTLGTGFVCLLSDRTQFVTGRKGRLYNDRPWCEREERWEVKEAFGGRFNLRRYGAEAYVSCLGNGDVIMRGKPEFEERFLLFINQTDDRLSMYNPTHKRFIIAKMDGKMRCDSTSNKPSATWFYGWKLGEKSLWKARDEGRYLKTFDNSKSSKPKRFTYTKTMGVKISSKSKAGIRTASHFDSSIGLSPFFLSKSFKSTTDTDWAKENKRIWGKAYTKQETVYVDPRAKVKLYQTVGTYGPLDIYSAEVMEAEMSSETMKKEMVTT